MANPTLEGLLKKTGDPELLQKLTGKLSLSELTSLLLEVFRAKAQVISPAELLKAYQANRFVGPSEVDAVTFRKLELQVLELARGYGFEALELSPLAPLGNCSALGLADQNKIVSAVRGTEVLADATNLMALEAAVRRKASAFDGTVVNLSTTHRHVRAQALPPNKGFTAHFKLFCMISAGKDRGGHGFEQEAVLNHLSFYHHFLVRELKLPRVKIILKTLRGEGSSPLAATRIMEHIDGKLKDAEVSLVEAPHEDHRYYQDVRFSINIVMPDGGDLNLGDGGLMDWSAKLTGNSKERLVTSGLGIELLLKLVLQGY